MSKKFLLIIESEPNLREELSRKMDDGTNMVVVTAKDGVEAFQKTRNQKFHVIFTDYNVPKISSTELLEVLRESAHNMFTPIIIYTDNIDAAKVSTRGTKFLTFLNRPQEYDDLVSKVIELSTVDHRKKKFKLDVDFINPFIDSSLKTLNGLCGLTNIEAQKPGLLTDELLAIDISGTLAISSPYFKGSIAISFNDEVYKKVISKMLEENIAEVSLSNQDGAAEIINIIFGQTKAILNQQGYNLARAIPSVLRGKGHKIYQDTSIPVILVPFTSSFGNFWIQICVKAD